MSRESIGRKHYFAEFIEKVENQRGLQEFVEEHDQNLQLITDINNILEKFAVVEVDEILYDNLFHLYQDGNPRCQHFVLQFLPALISNYFSLIGRKRAVGGGKLETLLLAIYNKEVSSNVETPFVKSYRIPSLSNSSVYHEPASTTSSALTERALSRHEQSDKPVMMKVPTKVLNRVTVSKRSDVIATTLDVYNRIICVMTEPSHVSFCRMTLRLARSGFMNFDCDDGRLLKVLQKSELDAMRHYARIRLSNDVYQQMIIGLYFIMHDGLADNAIIAIENLAAMSKYLLNSSLTMTLNALTDSIKRSQAETRAASVSRNPSKSVRRVADTTQRRYAVSSTNSLPRPNPIKDYANSGPDKTEKSSEPERDVCDQDRELNADDVTETNEKTESELSLGIERAIKMPSESEDEAVNENTTLLDNAKSESRTENSDIVCDYEMVKLTITNSNDADVTDSARNETCVKLVTSRDEYNRFDTAL